MNKTAAAGLSFALSAALLTAGCSGSDSSAPVVSPSGIMPGGGGANVVAPVMIDPATATTVEVPLGNTVVFNVEQPDKWLATVADGAIATFVPGGDKDGWVANPGLTPLAEGSTDVTVTGPDGATHTFTLTVKGSISDDVTGGLMVSKETSALADSLIGMSEQDAVAKVEATGRVIRIGRRDKETFALTMDYSPTRINIEVDNGKVTSVNIG